MNKLTSLMMVSLFVAFSASAQAPENDATGSGVALIGAVDCPKCMAELSSAPLSPGVGGSSAKKWDALLDTGSDVQAAPTEGAEGRK